MPAKIDIDALKISQNQEQGDKKLKTASLKIYRFWKGRVYFDLLIFEKFWNLKT